MFCFMTGKRYALPFVTFPVAERSWASPNSPLTFTIEARLLAVLARSIRPAVNDNEVKK